MGYDNNLRLYEIATGAESGTWGTTTNTNLGLIADAFGSGTEAITTNADTHTTTVADGAADEGRAFFLKYTGTLDSACTITLAPNDLNKCWLIENATSGSQNIIISQGSGANITIGNGKVAAIFTDGAGSGAAVLDAFADLELSSTLTVAGASTLTGAVTAAAGITMTGTTPTLTIGDAGAEDTKIVFDGAAQDYYVGLDDTDDDLKIGLGSTVGTTPAITIDENQNTTITNDLQVSATGPHGIGYTASDYISLVVGGAFTSGGATTRAGGLVCRTVLTGAVGDTAILSTMGAGNAWGSSIATQGTDTNISVISTMYLSDPDITNNLASSGKPDYACTLYVKDAPTEGDTNYSLFVHGGATQISGTFTADGGAVFNDASADVDFRVESNGNANMLFVDGGNDRVGIGIVPTHNFNLSSAGDVEARFASTDGNCSLQISSDTDEGQDSTLAFLSGTSSRGSIVYDHHTTAGSQKMEFHVGDNGTEAAYFAGDATFWLKNNLVIDATKRFYLDGGGDTYFSEATANRISFVLGGAEVLNLGTPTAKSVTIQADGLLYLDGGADTYIHLISNNIIGLICGDTEAMRVTDGAGTMTGTWTVTGALSKGSGSFRIDHPIKPETHDLVHSFVEGPRADLIYRGVVSLSDGWAEVDLDEAVGLTEGTWAALCRDPQVWVQNDSGWSSVRGSVEGNTLKIESKDVTSDDTVSWLVVAERQDEHIREADWTDSEGHPILEPEKVDG